ncbi:MAG: xanthine dehydrogenase family protein subunit M [Candidatus Cloacimonetes bacterium]|nr:xanthine dehydrogenase family protein subunit M [Candidatus Cloacimonadota bacterium]
MAIAHEFSYERPQNLHAVLELKDSYRNRALIYAGGTDLVVNIKEGMVKPELLIDIKDLPELHKLCLDNGTLYIGAAVTFTDLIDTEFVFQACPMLHDACKTVASTGVRSRATLVGNICSAVPSLDSATPLLCYEAVVHCASVEGTRNIPISEWFLAPRKTAIKDREVVTGISLKIPKEKSTSVYLKLGRYGGEDLAQAGWGIWLNNAYQYRIAHCALAPIPSRAAVIEAMLNGKELTPQLIEAAVALIPQEINPISDIRSSKEYRLHVSGVMLKRGLLAAIDRMEGRVVEPAKLLGGIT